MICEDGANQLQLRKQWLVWKCVILKESCDMLSSDGDDGGVNARNNLLKNSRM